RECVLARDTADPTAVRRYEKAYTGRASQNRHYASRLSQVRVENGSEKRGRNSVLNYVRTDSTMRSGRNLYQPWTVGREHEFRMERPNLDADGAYQPFRVLHKWVRLACLHEVYAIVYKGIMHQPLAVAADGECGDQVLTNHAIDRIFIPDH